MNDRMTAPWAEYALARFPEDPRDQLRAWDAADTYLLRHLAESGTPLSGSVVVVGDRWGALATALSAHRPTQITDSFLAQEATRANLARNGVEATAGPAADHPGHAPRPHRRPARPGAEEPRPAGGPAAPAGARRAREDRRRGHGHGQGDPHLDAAPLRTGSSARPGPRWPRRRRQFFCTPYPGIARAANPWPYSYRLPDGIGPVSGRTVVNHAGVFCADRLDIGTRFLLQHLPRSRGPERIVDLGCGNGVVGTAMALANPEVEVLFVDESYQAVASAEETYRENTDGLGAEFRVGDGLAEVPPGAWTSS